MQFSELGDVGKQGAYIAQQTSKREGKVSVTFEEFQKWVYDIVYCDVPVDAILKKQQPRTWIEKALHATARGLLGDGSKTVFENERKDSSTDVLKIESIPF